MPFPISSVFCGALRRRMTLLRLIERVGVAVAISAAVALPLIGLIAWRGAGAMLPTLLCLGLGVLAGIAWGVSSAPSMLEAALEADRQLQWADLLASALFLRAAPSDQWRRAVLVDADRRCSGLSPSTVLLRRLTPQAWSGIALSITLVLALSAWVGLPTDSLAHDARRWRIAARRKLLISLPNLCLHRCRLTGNDDRPRLLMVRTPEPTTPPPPRRITTAAQLRSRDLKPPAKA